MSLLSIIPPPQLVLTFEYPWSTYWNLFKNYWNTHGTPLNKMWREWGWGAFFVGGGGGAIQLGAKGRKNVLSIHSLFCILAVYIAYFSYLQVWNSSYVYLRVNFELASIHSLFDILASTKKLLLVLEKSTNSFTLFNF